LKQITREIQIMTIIWLARHAETALPTVVHGAESDIDLGEHGRQQAVAAASWFQSLKPTVVVSSAMRRAMATAAPIAALCEVPHEIEPALHERMVGPFSQKSGAEVDAVWAQTVERWEAGETTYAYPGMESFARIRDRVLPAFELVARRHEGRRVVVVAHGVVCKVLLLSVLHDHSEAHWTHLGRALNLSVSELVPDGPLWRANRLLEVPPPVAELNAARLDVGGKKTEA
jgi:2,3-bisphosphoglycerate-dependent phosphoglycerate mutase